MTWQNDLYEQLAAGTAEEVNPIAASLLETLDDPRFLQLRETLCEELHLQPGERVLELGCGPGMLLEPLYQRVGPTGKIDGLDLNPHFIRVADRRVEMLEIENATFTTGDCHTLPYDDETFDAVVAEKLLMHVAPIRRIIDEMSRVLVPGGRVVMADYDPFTVMVAGPDPSITARVMASASRVYASPMAARETAVTCVQTGLYVENVRGYLQVFEDPDAPTVSGVPTVWSEHATAGRQVDRGTARRWLKMVELAASEKRFLISIPFLITVAIRTPSAT